MQRRRVITAAALGAAGTALALSKGTGYAAERPALTGEAGIACGSLAFDMPSVAALRASPRQAYAFYFPPYPVSIDNKDPAVDKWSAWLDPEGTGGEYRDIGGLMRDRPLPRPVRTEANWVQKDFETEVRQAIAMGLDGFVWEYHSVSSNPRWPRLPQMLAAVRAVDPGFKIMLSPDLTAGADTLPDGIVADVLAVKDAPEITRIDGRIVLATFYPERKPASWWDDLRASLSAQGVETTMLPLFLSWGVDKTAWAAGSAGYSHWGSAWASAGDKNRTRAAECRSAGKLYMAPILFEDTRADEFHYWEAGNSATLRLGFEGAIAGGADLVMLRTWNDYGEAWTAPSAKRGYAVSDLVSYYTTWYKTGQAPAIVRDDLYCFHRSHRTDAPFDTDLQKGTMTIPAGDPAANDVELLALLASPGTLVIRQGATEKTMDAAAGLASFKTALVPGTTPEFELRRGGQTVLSLLSGTPTRSSTVYQDMIYHAASTRGC